jgi:Ser/Thr protein kinase RdoA (MazF antagonist)
MQDKIRARLGDQSGLRSLPVISATHSILDADALGALVAQQYELADVSRTRLIRPGLNDVYEVLFGEGRRILRVYRVGWRSDDDLYWERELLDHLFAGGVPVTVVEPTRYGQPFVSVRAPEGRRQIMMFTFADGLLVREGRAKGKKPSVVEFPERYGALCAAVHSRADGFVSTYPRFALDSDHLLWRPWQAIAPLLDKRSADRDRLLEIVRELAARAAAISDELDVGPCHGDLTGGNAVLNNGELTMFDFDSGGIGPRAYDLAVFAWSMRLQQAPAGTVERFMAGYRRVRPLAAADSAVIPLFEAIREIWFMGLQSKNAADWGYGLADDDFFDYRLGLLDQIVSEVR